MLTKTQIFKKPFLFLNTNEKKGDTFLGCPGNAEKRRA